MRAAEVTLTSDQRTKLRSWLAAGKTEWRLAFRAQIILALADGLTNKEAAGRLATRPATVSKWRGRFARHGLAGVADAPRSGKPRHYDAQDERRFSELWMRRRRPVMRVGTAPCWASIGAISPSTRSGGCCGSTRSRWSGGGAGASAPIRRSHRRPRTLSRSICSLRRTPWCYKNIHFHFRPRHASWLNQVEVWFSILSSHALAGASFTSPRQVRDQIDAFITAYNQDAHPFEWTKQVVFSKHPRSSYANLRN